MRKVLVMIILAASLPSFALDVDNNELRKARKVDFVNYTGKDRRQVSPADIVKIGRSLAKDSAPGSRVRFYMKYSMMRADSPENDGHLAADIFSIDRSARVNHVNVIRGILSAYIQKKFGYSKSESDAIALVTTYYNAIYRGNTDYLGGVYKRVVMNEIRRDNAGMSTMYYEWPGKTKILIPLTEGKTKGIDVITANDEKVNKELRSRKDKSVNERKDIVKVEEKQIDRNKSEIAKKEDDLKRKKEENKEKKDNLEKEKKSIQKEKTELEQKKAENEKIKDPKEREKAKEKTAEKEKDIAKKDENIKKKEDAVKKEDSETDNTQKDIDRKKEEVRKQEQKVSQDKEQIKKDEDSLKSTNKDSDKNDNNEKKDSDIKKNDSTDKESIAKEKKKIEEEKEKIAKEKKELEIRKEEVSAKLDKVYKDKFYYLKVNNWFNDGIYNNEMYIINPASRKVILKSPFKTIAGRKYDIFPKGVVVIGYLGKEKENFDHRLVILSPDKLEKVKEGSDIIFWRSFIEIRDSEIYCILMMNGKFYLARYNDNLERIGKSDVEVDKDSVITFYESSIYINSPDRKIFVLKKEDLKYVQTIDPETDRD